MPKKSNKLTPPVFEGAIGLIDIVRVAHYLRDFLGKRGITRVSLKSIVVGEKVVVKVAYVPALKGERVRIGRNNRGVLHQDFVAEVSDRIEIHWQKIGGQNE